MTSRPSKVQENEGYRVLILAAACFTLLLGGCHKWDSAVTPFAEVELKGFDGSSQIMEDFNGRSSPVTLVVSPEGRILKEITGEQQWDDPRMAKMLVAVGENR